MAYKMRQVRIALRFKERWAANPEGMEKRRRAGVRANAAAWARAREGWREMWGTKEDRLTPAQAKALAESFLKQMRGKWRTKKHPRNARSVLKRVVKLGIWKFDDALGLYLNPRMEQARQMEQARMREAEAIAERRAAEAREAEAAKEAEMKRFALFSGESAPAGWEEALPRADLPAVLGWLLSKKYLSLGQSFKDAKPIGAEIALSAYASPETWPKLLERGNQHAARMCADLAAPAEALLCAD